MAAVITGAKAAVFLNGEPMFFVGSIDVDIENRLEEIPQLDSLLVAEYAENGHRASFVVSNFKLAPGNELGLSNNAVDHGIEVSPGDPIQKLTSLEEMIWQVLDQDTGALICEMVGCKFNGGSGSLAAGGIWQGSWRFKARLGRGL